MDFQKTKAKEGLPKRVKQGKSYMKERNEEGRVLLGSTVQCKSKILKVREESKKRNTFFFLSFPEDINKYCQIGLIIINRVILKKSIKVNS